MNELAQNIYNLIAKDRLEEAIDLMIKELRDMESDIVCQTIVISREIYGLKRADVSFEDLNRNRNRIAMSIINLLYIIK